MKIVIVGAGPAGLTATETLRAQDNHTEIVVISDEPYPPYSPPAMVDHFLSGSKAHLWRGEYWPEEIGVEYRSGTKVIAIEPEDHRLQLSKDGALEYDKLVIASGSRLYAPLEGADLPGVYNFKSLSAAEALIKKIEKGNARSALIVGAGFIGMEIALLLQGLSVNVTQVEMLDQVMPRMLDKETASFALRAMRGRGVSVRLNTKARAFTGDKKVRSVELESGEQLEADLYIAATGVMPNVDFLEGSGIKVNTGIVVDDYLQTNIQDIFAAGDVVESSDRLTGDCFVHPIFPNAVEQGRVVGLNILGYEISYEGADQMNSLKHLDVPIMAAGLKDGDEVLRVRRDGSLRTLYLKDNRIVGFQLIGDVHPAGVFRSLMNRKEDIRSLKDHLLEPTFGQGIAAWRAITAPRV
ncbi:MAG: FAD-dependent oxidoreductase [Anaerolineales bacterium]|nr:FAD-dependent oxidoreductase [Anaerolineales bacterium]